MSDVLHFAFEYGDMGLSYLPLRGKRLAIASWRHLTARRPRRRETIAWFRRRGDTKPLNNIGIVCGRISRVVALDIDDAELVSAILAMLPQSDMMTRTARGMHIYYQIESDEIVPTRVKFGGIPIDIRGESSYVVAPPSIHPETGRTYERIGNWNLSRVPQFGPRVLFKLETIAAERFARNPVRIPPRKPARVRNGPAYIAHIRAVSGGGGHNALFRAACKLRDAGLSPREALTVLIDWNQTNCFDAEGNPYAWTMRELVHKVRDAYKSVGEVSPTDPLAALGLKRSE